MKQENLKSEKFPSKSLNYQMKKKVAQQIDSENHKIMERIVSQGPIMSTKKLQKEYEEIKKIKKMKDKTNLNSQIDKILE